MKHLFFFFVFISLLLSINSVFAGNDTNSYVCDPDVIERNLLTRTCWFYDSEGQKVIDTITGYAGKTEVYKHLIDIEGRYDLIMTTLLDPAGGLISGPGGYAKMTIEHNLHESGPVCRYHYIPDDPVNDLCGFTRRYFDEKNMPVQVNNIETV